MKKRSFLIYLLVAALILSLISFAALTGCRKAKLERLKNLKESQEASGEEVSQGEKAEETGDDQEGKDSNSEQQQGEEQQEEESTETETSEEETEETEQEETAESSAETDEETAEETIQMTEEFVNLDMEGGSISRDGFKSAGVGCGDNTHNEEIRAFSSFDISGIAGAEILEAKIKAIDGRKDGVPFAKYGPMIIKAVYWGPFKISPSNFDIDGVELANFTDKDFTIANTRLKNDLQNAVNNGLERYQICLYFEMENTDGDGIQDLIHYDPDKVMLTVTYSIAGE